MSSGLGLQNWPRTQLVWGATSSLFQPATLGVLGDEVIIIWLKLGLC